MIKERNPNLIVAQFWHVPWPNPEVFRGFPWREELLDGLLGNDLIGFHLRLACQNFEITRFEDGVRILSEFAGASRELTDAVVVNPFDEEQVAEAMRSALEMEPSERRRRRNRMRAVVAEGNVYRWIGKILSTLLKFEFHSGDQASSGTQAPRVVAL